MANDIFNYCVATNTGKGVITHDDSRRFWIVVIQLMCGYVQTVLNQDIGSQETMELLKQNQKLKLL